MATESDIQLTNDTLFGIAIQKGSGATQYELMSTGYDTPLEPSDGYYFATTDIAVAPIKNMEALPPEIQARALPGGMFPTGAWMEGVASMIPRMDNRFGWLLLALPMRLRRRNTMPLPTTKYRPNAMTVYRIRRSLGLDDMRAFASTEILPGTLRSMFF